MLDTFTKSTFSKSAGKREPFSILFNTPGDTVLSQKIYRIEHDTLGTFDLFLVPINKDKQGVQYEAVFT
jgi:hypothetical protein